MTKFKEVLTRISHASVELCRGCRWGHPSQTRHSCLTKSRCQQDRQKADFLTPDAEHGLKAAVFNIIRRRGEREFTPLHYHSTHTHPEFCCDWIDQRLQKWKIQRKQKKITKSKKMIKKMINKKLKKYTKIWLSHPMYIVKKLNMYQLPPEIRFLYDTVTLFI